MGSVRNRPVSRRSFFTLIEIMIVVVIIGLIMTLVGPDVIKKLKKAQSATARNQIHLLGNAIDDYYLDLSTYPSKMEDLIANPGNPKWDGPYLKPPKIPKDPWGAEYGYRNPGTQNKGGIDAWSPGPDGQEGNADDVGNWNLEESDKPGGP